MAILVHLLALVVLGALMTWLEQRWPSEPGRRWWRRPWRADLCHWLAGPVVERVARGLLLLALGVSLVGLGGIAIDRGWIERMRHPDSWFAHQPPAVQVLLAVVGADFVSYWVHRAMHRVPWLWPLHAVHHSSTQLDWFAARRNHPLNVALNLTVFAAAMLVAGVPLDVLAGVAPLLGLFGVLGHANLRWRYPRPLRLVFASPIFHRWHHTAIDEGGDRNFAAFLPLWDRLFGTWYLPEDRSPQRFGIAGDPVPPTYLGQMLHPFAAWRSAWRRWRSTHRAGSALGACAITALSALAVLVLWWTPAQLARLAAGLRAPATSVTDTGR